jgi:hypothetical protein
MHDNAYETYQNQVLAKQQNLGEVMPWHELDAAGLAARVTLED